MRPRKDFFSLTSHSALTTWVLRSLLALTLLTGCDSSSSIELGEWEEAPTPPSRQVKPLPHDPGLQVVANRPATNVVPAARPIRIASFNIQIFGQTKMANPKVVEILTDIVQQFDIVAVQEIRCLDQDLLPNFLSHVNRDGRKYHFVIGPRLGRTRMKEQYAFIFNTETVRLFWPSVYTLDDEQDVFHREPLIASFQAITDGANPFRFTLMNVHLDPEEARYELSKLDDAFRATQMDVGGEDDVILAGDLNANPRDYQELGRLANVAWAVVGIPTNTRGTQGYDNLLFDRMATVEYLGRSGVMDIQTRYGITLAEALEVSDHLPVWAEFYPYEVQPGLDLAAPALNGQRK